MAPTDKVGSTTTVPVIAIRTIKKFDKPTSELPAMLSVGKSNSTTVNNFNTDLLTGRLELKKCPRIFGIKAPLCEDEYVLHPKDGQTFGDAKNRYGILDGYFREHGQATQLPGNADNQEIMLDMPINKEDLENFVGVNSPKYAKVTD